MEQAINVSGIIESNGKTVRENNTAKVHNIPIGSLVEVKWDEWHGDGACWKVHARLWVVTHDRDCDGTPLYGISKYTPEFIQHLLENIHSRLTNLVHYGFAEGCLTVVEIIQELKDGVGALEWSDEELDRFNNITKMPEST